MNTEEKLRKILDQDYQQLSGQQQQKVLDFMKNQQLNILVVGATGAGKSSTINALFDIKDADVGFSADPMTIDITRYDFGNLILWDTPGLGDGVEADKQHTRKIIHQLTKKNEDGTYIIELVLVIIDGSSRDMGTSFDLINNVVIPNLGDTPSKRILVAINQADIAYKGPNGWNYEKNTPTELGVHFLDDKVQNVKQRIFDSTGITVVPIYYCAGYQSNEVQQRPFNLSKLLYLMVNKAPPQKRLALRSNLSKKKESWSASDERINYNAKTKESFGLGKILGGIVGFLFGFL